MTPEETTSVSQLQNSDAGRIAILGDMPGTDRAALERLARSLREAGFGVTFLSGEQVREPSTLKASHFFLYVIPNARVYPADGAAALAGYLEDGGHLMTQGGPAFTDPAWWRDGRWLTRSIARSLNASTQPERVVFDFEEDDTLDGWTRNTNYEERPGGGTLVADGACGSGHCLKISTEYLTDRETFSSPERPALFPKGHGLLCFRARGDDRTSQILVEVGETDESKWLATVDIGKTWTHLVLAAQDFTCGGRGDARKSADGTERSLDLGKAVQVSFGMVLSHNLALGRGPHSFLVDQVGSAPDPYPEAATQNVTLPFVLDTISPSHKVYPLDGITLLKATPGQCLTTSAKHLALPSEGIAPITIPTGTGYGRNRARRWVPVIEAQGGPDGEKKGALVSMLFNAAPPIQDSVLVSLGFQDPALLGDAGWSSLITQTAVALRRGLFLKEAGSSQFSYWPDEPFDLGACVRNLSSEATTVSVSIVLKEAEHGRTVFEKTEDLTLEPGKTNSLQTHWRPQDQSSLRYLVRTELRHDGHLIDVILHDIGILDTGKHNHDEFVTVRGSDFYLRGKKWYPVGVNFWPSYVHCAGAHWLAPSGYDPVLIEDDLDKVQELGINTLSIMAGDRDILDFLRRCEERDIKVIAFLDGASPIDFNEAKVRGVIDDGRLADNPTIFAYDIIWEPGNWVFAADMRKNRWDGPWREWLDERYGSVENAEKDWNYAAPRSDGQVVSPSDGQLLDDGPWRVMAAAYRRFMDDLMSPKWNRAVRKMKEIDPNHLVTFRQGNTRPLDFTLTATPKHTDFVCPEGYSFEPLPMHFNAAGFISRYIHFTSGGKPILWSEFGKSVWDPMAMRSEPRAMVHQASYHENFYKMILESGANGAAPWWWPGGLRADEKSDYGIIGPDGSFRPSARLIMKYGKAMTTPREYPAPDVWLTIDRDVHCAGYWALAFNEGQEAYAGARAEGKNLGIRTAGTGTTSSNTALLAVGNTPLTPDKPPKYLNAEFNWLRIQGADGQWVDVEGDADMTVRVGEPVLARVSVGNVQEAEWLAPLPGEDRATGRVYLASGADSALVFTRGVPCNTPWLQDADFGEFVLADDIVRPTAVVLQMNVEGLLTGQAEERVWFGEKARFTLVPARAE